jgi:uncharacterized protein (DUF58 family)
VRPPAPPPLPPRFPPAFRTLLHDLLARGPRLLGARVEQRRARRAQLSQSGTFVGHRPYALGDDLRRLDWAAYARTGDLFVKQLEEEERRQTTLWIDCSASMHAGEPARQLAALRLCAVLGGLALRHLDGLVLAAPGGGADAAAFFGLGDLDRLLRVLDGVATGDQPPLQTVQALLRRGAPGRLHWVSDFADPARFEPALAVLRRAGCRVTGWLPGLDADRRAVARGFLRLCDPETGAMVTVAVDDALAAELQRQLDVLRRRQDRMFAQCGYSLVRWPAPAADDLRWSAWQEIVARCST